MINTYQAIINKQGKVQLLEALKVDEPKRAILIVFDEDFEESLYEKTMPYLMSEGALARDWNKEEENEAWAYLQKAN